MILEAALQAGPQGSLRPHTLFTLVGLLASTGLRVGEALRLDCDDVQLQTELPRLHVRDTKFGKSRLVPVHATTAGMLRLYIRKRTELEYDGLSNSFLVSEQGTGLRISNVDRWFGQLVLQLGLWPDKGKSWPCLRCFRHTFAVRRLRAWYEEGADVAMLLPHLSVYLGHVDLEESYWYLTATPELLDHASVCFQRYAHVGGQQ